MMSAGSEPTQYVLIKNTNWSMIISFCLSICGLHISIKHLWVCARGSCASPAHSCQATLVCEISRVRQTFLFVICMFARGSATICHTLSQEALKLVYSNMCLCEWLSGWDISMCCAIKTLELSGEQPPGKRKAGTKNRREQVEGDPSVF